MNTAAPVPGIRASTRSTGISLVHRAVEQRLRFILVIAVTTASFAVMVGALYPSIGVAYDDVLADLPPAFEGMLGGADFSTPEGFLHVELFAFLAPALAISAAISVGASALAGAEQNGQLTLVMSCPVRRSQIVSAAIGAVVIAASAVAVALYVGIVVGAAVGGFDISLGRTGEACLSVALLAISCGAVAIAVGAATGRRGAAVGVASAIAVASYGVDAFFPLSTHLSRFAKISLWYPSVHSQPLLNGLQLSHAAILVLLSAALVLLSYWLFEHRDLS